MEKRLLKADELLKPGETLERFTLREPIKRGEPPNTFDRIAAVLADRFEKRAAAGESASRLDASLLDLEGLAFVLKDPVLTKEWTRLSLVKAGAENASIRSSGAYSALPPEYKALGPLEVRNISESLPAFERGRVGDKRPDVVDFFLDQRRAVVTDITQQPNSPCKIQTLFYQKALSALTGMTVRTVELTGKSAGSPKITE